MSSSLIEVLSPSTAKKDKLIKYNRYQRAGVKEYWIIDPIHETIEVYCLNEKEFQRNGVFVKGELLPVSIFEDFTIELDLIFRTDAD